MAVTVPTTYSQGPNAHLYIEPLGTLYAQINGVYALNIIFLLFCTITVSLRMYVRAVMVKGVTLDDWILLLTLAIFVGYAILLCIVCAALLENAPEYADGEVPTSPIIPRMIVAGYELYCATMIVFKFSLGFFFLKIFSHQRAWRITIWLGMVLPGLLGLLNVAWTAYFPCQLAAVFFPGLAQCASDFRQRTDWVVVAALWAGVSAVTDLLYGWLAFVAIKGLQLPWRTRLTAGALCSLGCVGGVAACVRLAFLIAVVPGISVLGGALHVSIWSVIEPGLAIVAASVASLRPLYMRMRDPHYVYGGFTVKGPSMRATGPRGKSSGMASASRQQDEVELIAVQAV